MFTRRALIALIALIALVAGSSPTGALGPGHEVRSPDELHDSASVHGSVTPPGTDTRHATTEIAAYDDLVQGYTSETLDEDLLTRYFKDGKFGVEDDEIERMYHPRPGTTVIRDRQWGVPHIFGDTDFDVAYGAGYVAAEDRLAIMELLRALGRSEAFELLGTAPAWFADAEMARLYGYTEAEFQAQLDRLPAIYGPDGQFIVEALEHYTAGVNAYLADAAAGEVPVPTGVVGLLSEVGDHPNDGQPGAFDPIVLPAPYTPTDVVAMVSTVRALFGAGGGNELGNAVLWNQLTSEFGATAGAAIYNDFRNRYNTDGVTHTLDSFGDLDLPLAAREVSPDPVVAPKPANLMTRPSAGKPGIQVTFENIGAFLAGLPGTIASASTTSSEPTLPLIGGDGLEELADEAAIKWDRLKLETPAGVIDLSHPGSLSNYMVVDGTKTADGHPLLIGGPQAGYFSPQILMEYELHGENIHARGSGFPGLNSLVIIGRTGDYAFSPTAGGSDMIDHYVVELCDPDGGPATEHSTGYVHDLDVSDGFDPECLKMDRRVHRLASAAPLPLAGEVPDIIVERTVQGTVVARGELDGAPVAVVRKRSTYGKEIDAAIAMLRVNRGDTDTAEKFTEVMAESMNLSTNWGYASTDEIAYVHGGLYPVRPLDLIDPDFPVWGDGRYEWKKAPPHSPDHLDWRGADRYLRPEQHPHEENPARHYTASWNNRPAPDWPASDSQWGFHSLYRVDMLEDQVQAAADGSIDAARLVQIMEQAGLTDFRGSHVLPSILEVIRSSGVGLTALQEEMVEILEAWADPDWATTPGVGPLRRDADDDGEYEASTAVAIMDALWEPVIRRVFDPATGNSGRFPLGFDNAPNSGGSAYQGGYYGYVWTALQQALGEPITAPQSTDYCGAGAHGDTPTLADCAEALLDALDDAAADLGGNDPSAWGADASAERITFLPAAFLSMHWVNRPTTQHLASFR